jgi:hypothetical protein
MMRVPTIQPRPSVAALTGRVIRAYWVRWQVRRLRRKADRLTRQLGNLD